MSTFTLFTLFFYVVAASQNEMPAGVILSQSGSIALRYELSYAVALTLGMTIAAWIRQRTVYMIGLLCWIFGTYFIDVVISNQYVMFPLRLLHLSYLFIDSPQQHEVWGREWITEELGWRTLFIIIAVIAMSFTALFKLQAEEPGLERKRWKRYAIAGCLVTMISTAPFLGMWTERLQMNNRYVQAIADEQRTIITSQQTYDYDLPMRPDETKLIITRERGGAIFFESVIKGEWLQQTAEMDKYRIDFTLDSLFEVKEVYLNGKAVPYQRDGSWLSLQAKQTALSSNMDVRIRYAMIDTGRVDWNGGGEKITHSVERDALWLNGRLQWYPTPGKVPIYSSINRGITSVIRSEVKQQQFHIKLNGFDEAVYTNLPPDPMNKQRELSRTFSGLEGDGIYIWSGQFESIPVPDSSLQILAGPSSKEAAKQFANQLSSAMSYYREWLQLPNEITQILYMPTDHLVMHQGLAKVSGNTYVMMQHESHHFDEYTLTEAISILLFGSYLESIFTEASEQKDRLLVRKLILKLGYQEMNVQMRNISIAENNELSQMLDSYTNSSDTQLIKQYLSELYLRYDYLRFPTDHTEDREKLLSSDSERIQHSESWIQLMEQLRAGAADD